jgi:hypothetical protein
MWFSRWRMLASYPCSIRASSAVSRRVWTDADPPGQEGVCCNNAVYVNAKSQFFLEPPGGR